MNTVIRSASAVAAAGLLLTMGACRTSPCSPSSCAREPSPCAPPAPPPVAYLPPPAPPPSCVCTPIAPKPNAAEGERLRIQEETIARQQEAIVAERTAREAAEANAKASRAALDAAKSSPRGEDDAEKLETELRGIPGARVLREGSRVVVVITDAFEPGSDVMKPNTDVRTAILSTAAAILRHPETHVSVVGHSDGQPLNKSAGKWKDNVDLSKARASTVAKAMGASGVSPDRLAVDGRGAAEPMVSPEKTKADRAKNRRVEIQLSF